MRRACMPAGGSILLIAQANPWAWARPTRPRAVPGYNLGGGAALPGRYSRRRLPPSEETLATRCRRLLILSLQVKSAESKEARKQGGKEARRPACGRQARREPRATRRTHCVTKKARRPLASRWCCVVCGCVGDEATKRGGNEARRQGVSRGTLATLCSRCAAARRRYE